MRYLCLVYADEARLDAMPQPEVDDLIDETAANNEELAATDGPFAETNEQLGGFVLIEARDLNEAVRIAGRIPGARIGSIEVRPVIDRMRERSPR
jgi:hypothetical protein